MTELQTTYAGFCTSVQYGGSQLQKYHNVLLHAISIKLGYGSTICSRKQSEIKCTANVFSAIVFYTMLYTL